MDHRIPAPQTAKADRTDPALAEVQFLGHVGIPADAALKSGKGVGFFRGHDDGSRLCESLRGAAIIAEIAKKETFGDIIGVTW
jgi:hypothetical protein